MTFHIVCKTASRDNLNWSSSTNIFGSVISHKQVEAKIDGWSENLTDSVCRPKCGRQGATVTNVRNIFIEYLEKRPSYRVSQACTRRPSSSSSRSRLPSSSDEKYDSTSDTSCLAAVKKEARRLGLCPRRHFVSKNMATRTSPSRVGSLRAMHHAINMKLSINFELTIDFKVSWP